MSQGNLRRLCSVLWNAGVPLVGESTVLQQIYPYSENCPTSCIIEAVTSKAMCNN